MRNRYYLDCSCCGMYLTISASVILGTTVYCTKCADLFSEVK